MKATAVIIMEMYISYLITASCKSNVKRTITICKAIQSVYDEVMYWIKKILRWCLDFKSWYSSKNVVDFRKKFFMTAQVLFLIILIIFISLNNPFTTDSVPKHTL